MQAKNIITKVILHSFAALIVTSIITLVIFCFDSKSTAKYAFLGTLTAVLLRLALSKKKYLAGLTFINDEIHIKYFTSLLLRKKLILKEGDSFITYVDEVNKFLSDRDQVQISIGKENFQFINLDKSLRTYILEAIGEEV